jgi:hypothetical protein
LFTLTDDEISKEDLRSIASMLENYFENSNHRVEMVIENFGRSITKEKAQFDFAGDLSDLSRAIVKDIYESDDIENFLEYMGEEDSFHLGSYFELKEKYFPETPEGTYAVSIPEIRDSQISPNPESGLDPTLHESEYMQILNALNSSGSGIEQAISSFTSLDEEGFRDVMLNGLKTAFPKYSASGEVFNVSGKTDILLKRDNQNLFIAECKIWRGKAQIESTIKQLMDYLTWRDTKTALIFFVQNTDFTSVLKQFPDVIKSHPKCKVFLNKFNENRFDFEFVQKDSQKSFRMTVFCFDFKFTPP